MKKWKTLAFVGLFVLLLVGLWLFLSLVSGTQGAIPIVEWETAVVVDAQGGETPFDMLQGQPDLAPGEYCHLALTLPAREDHAFLVFEVENLELELFLDGEALYQSSAVTAEGALNTSQVHVSLPPGGGELLEMDVVPLGEAGMFPPLLRLTEDPADTAGTMAYANYYGIPGGAVALAVGLLWGLFLFGAWQGRPAWKLLLLIFAGTQWLLCSFARGFGETFLPEPLLRLLIWEGWAVLALLAPAAYLALHREKAFWKALGVALLGSAGLLWAGYLLSLLGGGRLASQVDLVLEQASYGSWDNLLYYCSLWLVLLCALLAAWEFLRSVFRIKMQNRSLELKDQLLMENYRSLEGRVREEAAQRHEAAHNLAAMDAMLQERDWEGLRGFLSRWKEEANTSSPPLTGNYAMDAILQDAAKNAKRLGAAFTAEALVPKELPLPYQDLCPLLMNLLDNALEACAQVEDPAKRFVRFRAAMQQGFLAIKCENSYRGPIQTDGHGRPLTTKADPESHGFGIPKMTAIAEKYHSILDVRYTDDTFLVQTALKLPK